MAQVEHSSAMQASNPAKRVKLTGRAFYESIGSPKMIVAPMVDRSEFAWRVLTRSYLDEDRSKQLLAYSPMLHARLFREQAKFRDAHFQPTKESMTSKEPSPAKPFLDGNAETDRPLFVQFCANKPDDLLEAAQYVAPYCDAVDLNLGCPQGIAKSGQYGAFLQEHWDKIHAMISKLNKELDVPITAKMRILDTKERTLEYAKMILSAGASILTVHGRRREQKSHNTGVADWKMIRYLRDNLPPETVMFANGNILNWTDIQPCLEATGVDGVMSAEGNLSDPTIFALPPEHDGRRVTEEYWRDPRDESIGGFRIDAVVRRYLDIIHKYVLEHEPPQRKPLYVPGQTNNQPDQSGSPIHVPKTSEESAMTPVEPIKTSSENSQPLSKKQRKNHSKKEQKQISSDPNLKALQGHLFQLLRCMLPDHTHIRDVLAKCKSFDIAGFERVSNMVDEACEAGLRAEHEALQTSQSSNHRFDLAELTGSEKTRALYRRPFWVCQPYIRPLPEEAIQIGAMTVSKKEKRLAEQDEEVGQEPKRQKVEKSQARTVERETADQENGVSTELLHEVPQTEALACG